ncbi:MAG: beta-lactamase family protein [Nitrospiraceae bacterium]|nr:beta-lactamase family protein [Nitrospiraceae bacterium]
MHNTHPMLLLTIALSPIVGAYLQELAPTPVAGRIVPDLRPFDEAMLSMMQKWGLKGGQLAIAKGGKLVFSRSYGDADLNKRRTVELDSLFRIGSVSKTFTTAAILKLVEAGKLRLSDRVLSLLSHLKPADGSTVDPRLLEITVQQLLQHAGGWQDTEPSFTMPFTGQVTFEVGSPSPPTCETVIRYQLSKRLDFDPGSKTSYSNFGFCILGRIIEAVASAGGKRVPYEEFVEREVLRPAGITRAKLGGTLPSERSRAEVRYYGPPNQVLVDSVYPGRGLVPFAYGGLYLRSTDSSGGWIASAEDLVKFATAIDGQRGRALLSPAMFRLMLDTPIPTTKASGLCWTVAKRNNGVDFWHTGAIKDSSVSWLVRTSEGATLAFVFNSFPADFNRFMGEVIPGILELIKAPRTWPQNMSLRWAH